jgi:plastocyanin
VLVARLSRLRGAALPATLALALALATAGCGTGSDLPSSSPTSSSATSSTATTADSGGAVRIVMQSLFFDPSAVHARVGQRVIWTNEDAVAHNVTYVSGPRFRSSRRRLNRGQKFAITLTQPGTIRYVCTLHPWMKATIVVSPP